MRMAGISGLFFLIGVGGAQATNFQVYNDKVWGFPIQCINVNTSVVGPCPTGTTFAATSSLPGSLAPSIASGTVYLTPLVKASPGITITVSGVALVPQAFVVDVVPDPNQLGVSLNVAGVGTTPQNIPSAPGP